MCVYMYTMCLLGVDGWMAQYVDECVLSVQKYLTRETKHDLGLHPQRSWACVTPGRKGQGRDKQVEKPQAWTHRLGGPGPSRCRMSGLKGECSCPLLAPGPQGCTLLSTLWEPSQ